MPHSLAQCVQGFPFSIRLLLERALIGGEHRPRTTWKVFHTARLLEKSTPATGPGLSVVVCDSRAMLCVMSGGGRRAGVLLAALMCLPCCDVAMAGSSPGRGQSHGASSVRWHASRILERSAGEGGIRGGDGRRRLGLRGGGDQMEALKMLLEDTVELGRLLKQKGLLDDEEPPNHQGWGGENKGRYMTDKVLPLLTEAAKEIGEAMLEPRSARSYTFACVFALQKMTMTKYLSGGRRHTHQILRHTCMPTGTKRTSRKSREQTHLRGRTTKSTTQITRTRLVSRTPLSS